jgi:hypothetical protein
MVKKVIFGLFILSCGFMAGQEARVLGDLPSTISETSGLLFFNGKLITHNDSGNTAQLFEVDTTSLQLTRTVTVLNAENIDWEDLAQDDAYIYVGDFGNNSGTRTDLVIYRINKQEYIQSDEVSAERINFAYEDQTEFTNNGNSDWDAEGFFWFNDELILLTKQWQSSGTVAYSIPDSPGSHVAKRLDGYDVDGLITGATYNATSDVLYLLGYTSVLSPFTVRVEGVTNSQIFSGTVERYTFGSEFAQVEGIAFVDVNTYFVSSEYFNRSSPSVTLESQLFVFHTDDTERNPIEPEPGPEPEPNEESLILYRAFGSNLLEYELTTDKIIFGRAIHNSKGQLVEYLPASAIESSGIDLSTLNSSVYYLTFYSERGKISKAFAK